MLYLGGPRELCASPTPLEHRRFLLSAPILPFSHLLRNRMKHIFLCVRHLCTYIHVVLQIQVDAGASARDHLDTYLTTYGYLGFFSPLGNDGRDDEGSS